MFYLVKGRMTETVRISRGSGHEPGAASPVGPRAVPCYTSRPVGRFTVDFPVGM